MPAEILLTAPEPPPLWLHGKLITEEMYGDIIFLRNGDFIDGCWLVDIDLVIPVNPERIVVTNNFFYGGSCSNAR